MKDSPQQTLSRLIPLKNMECMCVSYLLIIHVVTQSFSLSLCLSKSLSHFYTHHSLLHHNPHLNVPGNGNELELVSIKYSTETAVVGGILRYIQQQYSDTCVCVCLLVLCSIVHVFTAVW